MDRLFDALVDLDASAWAAWVALALTVTTLVGSRVGRWWRSRRADPVAWLERHGEADSVVLFNRGPADAVQVTVTITAPDGARQDLILADTWPLPLVLLAAGDLIFLPYVRIPGAMPPVVHAVVTWQDGRPWPRGQHRVLRATSVRPGTPGSLRAIDTPGALRAQATREVW